MSTFKTKFPRLQTQVPLAPFSTFQIGGPADYYYELTDSSELPGLMAEAKMLQLPYLILGGGSNILFSDKGFRGLVIHMKNKKIEVQEAKPTHQKFGEQTAYIIAEAGALLSQVVQAALKNGLSGMEKMMGLPGTIGGAVRGNAGAFGLEIKDIFAKAEIFNEEKGIQTVEKDYFQFGYRHSTIKKNKDIILKIYLQLSKKDTTPALKEMQATIISRAGKHPSGFSAGSFFKNPDIDQPAGRLLDEAGCKGLQVGKAQVAPKHANFILNLGGATQEDIIKLSTYMQQRVKEKFGIQLEREVQLVSETGFLLLP